MPDFDQETGLFVKQFRQRYSRIEMISSGGMGVVFRANDKILDKTVAIKAILINKAEPDAVILFQKEARALSKLNHDHLISVLDFGVAKSGSPYLIMDYVDGITLQELIDRTGPLAPDAVHEIGLQIADAMSHAHSRGVIHRDLKPGNIMMAGDPDSHIDVRIVDFGIAKDVTASESVGRITLSGSIAGSPAYMSPEQIKAESLDARSDIYSLGCIMYHALAGCPPFQEETSVETFNAHLYEAAAPLSLDNGNRQLAMLTMKCLEKSPTDRYESMDALKEALLGSDDTGSFEAQKTEDSSGKIKMLMSAMFIFLCGWLILALINFDQIERDDLVASQEEQPTEQEKVHVEREKFRVNPDHKHRTEHWEAKSPLGAAADTDPVTNQDLAFIHAKNYPIAEVDLAECYKVTSLSALPKLDIEELRVDGTGIDDSAAADINRFPNLHALDVSDTRVTDKIIEDMAPRNLYMLAVARTKISDRSIQLIVEKFPDLRSIDLGGTNVTIEGFEKLRELTHLTQLRCPQMTLSSRHAQIIRALPLESLVIQQCIISPEDFLSFARIGTLKEISPWGLVESQDAIPFVPNDAELIKEFQRRMPNCKIIQVKDDFTRLWEQSGDDFKHIIKKSEE